MNFLADIGKIETKVWNVSLLLSLSMYICESVRIPNGRNCAKIRTVHLSIHSLQRA